MDKQIIIDGVDVSGCRFYSEKLSTMKGTGSISTIKCNGFCTHNIRGLDDSSCYDAHIEYAKCKNNNCYYKQLARKEQECEQLKITIEENSYRYAELDADFEQSKKECEKLKKQLESTKGLATVGNRQLAEALLELQKYKDREQWEIELNKKRADSFKEMLKMLYGKVDGSSLIEKRNPYEN